MPVFPSMPEDKDELTRDAFLGGRLHARQPARGFRAGIDSVLLAASVPPKAEERILELGAGAGVAALCLAARVEDVHIEGIERERSLVALARENAAANGISARVTFHEGDATRPPAKTEAFDHVMMNPPYNDPAKGTPAPHRGKREALAEKGAALAAWIAHARDALKPGGRLTLVFRADRAGLLWPLLHDGFGAVRVLPLFPDAHRPARRILVAAVKGGAFDLRFAAGLTLHGGASKYTAEAEALLRDGALLDWNGAPPLAHDG